MSRDQVSSITLSQSIAAAMQLRLSGTAGRAARNVQQMSRVRCDWDLFKPRFPIVQGAGNGYNIAWYSRLIPHRGR